jgi:hypothetical protein
MLYVRFEYSLSEILDARILDFWILEYLHIHNKVSWEWDQSLNTKFMYVLYTPYSICLRLFFTVLLECLCFDCNLSHEVMDVMAVLKRFGFWSISDFIYLD